MNLEEMLNLAASGSAIELPETWMQGRTAYGGISTALAHAAAKQVVDNPPPLRSAQVAFVGPLAGAISAEATEIRRGKNSAYVSCDLTSNDGLGLRGNFIFANARESAVNMQAEFPADAPELTGQIGEHHSRSPQFFQAQIEFDGVKLRHAVRPGRILLWTRFRERAGVDPTGEVLAIGDALPPAVISALPPTAMISSMNWQINIVASDLTTDDGWWLLDTQAQHAANGTASQAMTIWNTRRELIATGLQAVAYYA